MGRVVKVTDEGSVDLYEAHANGAHKVSLKAPASLAADVVLTMPPDAGTSGYLLRTDGAGTLTWEPSTGTEEFAQITLLDQGRISLREAVGNGVNFVGFRAPASLAASIDFTMPPALPLTTQFLSCDAAGQWAYADGTSTLQSAYDEGAVIDLAAGTPIEITQANDEDALTITKSGVGAGVLLTLTDAGTGGCLSLVQTGNGVALTITKVAGAANVVTIAPSGAISGTGALIDMPAAGSGIGLDVQNDGSGIGIKATQATTSAILAQLNQGTINHALDLNRTSVDAATLAALDVSDAATGTASAVNITKTGAGSAITVNQGNTSAGVVVTQSTNGIGARFVKSGAGAGNAVEIENQGTGNGLFVENQGEGEGIFVQSDNDAIGITVEQNGDAGGFLVNVTASTFEPGIQITHAGSAGIAKDVNGTSSAWFVTNNGAGNFKALVTPPGAQLTIATGAITVTGSYHTVLTEAAAASDDLTTINTTLPSGTRLVLRAGNSARTVVLKDNVVNLALAGDFSLDSDTDTIELLWDGSAWYELGRSDNGA